MHDEAPRGESGHLGRGPGRGPSTGQNGRLDVGFEKREIPIRAGDAAMPQSFTGHAERIDGFAGRPALTEMLVDMVGKGLAHGMRAQGPGQLIGVVDLAQHPQRVAPADLPVGALAALEHIGRTWTRSRRLQLPEPGGERRAGIGMEEDGAALGLVFLLSLHSPAAKTPLMPSCPTPSIHVSA
jgi:hypothetical protein